jgi:hypothetical protein
VLNGERTIGREAEKARTVDFRMKVDGILDKIGKKAGLPGTNVDALNANLDTEDADAMGRQAYGANWEKVRQDRKDANWNDSLNQQAMGVRDNLQGINALQKRITEGDYSEKLDSNRRNSLVAKLDAYKTSLIQRNEAAAARAARQQELALKKAEAEFNTFQGLADKGTILSPEYIDRAVAATRGTPYQAGIVAVAKQAQETGGIASQPIRNQQALLTQVDTLIAQHGRTPELDKRREQINRALSASQADLKENGLRAGLERGVITDISTIDMSPAATANPSVFASIFQKRIEQAEHVSAWAGKPVSPLDAHEAETLRSTIDSLSPRQKSAVVAAIGQSVGPRFSSAIAEQLNPKDELLSLSFSIADQETSGTSDWLGRKNYDSRRTSELLFKGGAALKDGTVANDDKKITGWKATIAQEIDGAILGEKTADSAKKAAYYIAAGIASESGGTASEGDIKRAVRLAIDGEIIERNGKKLPIPSGWGEYLFEKRIRDVSAGDITRQAPDGKVRVAGVEMSAADFATSVPGQELVYAGQGRYAVIVKGRPVTNASGSPIFIKVK